MKLNIDRRRTYNTETARLVKHVVEVEELGEGYRRYNMRSLYLKEDTEEYFLWTNHTAVDRKDVVVDVNEWIVVVSEDWARRFNRSTPDLYG